MQRISVIMVATVCVMGTAVTEQSTLLRITAGEVVKGLKPFVKE